MASVTKFSYHRLRREGEFDEAARAERGFGRRNNFSRIRKFTVRKRLRVRILSLRRFLRKRAKLVSGAKVSWGKALKRLKNGHVYMKDLLGGNYLVMLVRPAPFKCGDHQRPFMGYGVHGLPPRYPLGRIA